MSHTQVDGSADLKSLRDEITGFRRGVDVVKLAPESAGMTIAGLCGRRFSGASQYFATATELLNARFRIQLVRPGPEQSSNETQNRLRLLEGS
jgi:hypothetical protein